MYRLLEVGQRALYRSGRFYDRLRDRLWFYPLGFIIGALVLFVATALVDRNTSLASIDYGPAYGIVRALVFGGTSDAARTILSAIASGWATIMGVIYSITIVVLQLAGSKFTSQVIPRFERDRLTQITLGSYTGLVAYTLLVLKTVRRESVAGTAFTPVVGVNLAIIWAIFNLLLVIMFIGRLVSLIEPASLVRSITADGEASLSRLTASVRRPWARALPDGEQPETLDAKQLAVQVQRAGYVQGIAWMALVRFVFFHPALHPDEPVYWFMMQVGMVIGFFTAYPMNWWLVRKGIKERM